MTRLICFEGKCTAGRIDGLGFLMIWLCVINTVLQQLLSAFVALASAAQGCFHPEWPETPISHRRTLTVVGTIHLVRPVSPARCRERSLDPDNFLLRLSSIVRPIAPSLLPSHPSFLPLESCVSRALAIPFKLFLSCRWFPPLLAQHFAGVAWQLFVTANAKLLNLLCLLHNQREAPGESAVPRMAHSFYFQAHLQKMTSVCRWLALQRCD